jgi:signal transduction histidine kinase
MLSAPSVDVAADVSAPPLPQAPPLGQPRDSQAADRTAYGFLPALLLLLAGLAFVWQAASPTSVPPAAPLLIAGCALSVASLLLVVPFVSPQLGRLITADTVSMLFLGAAAFTVARTGAPAGYLSPVLLAMVLAAAYSPGATWRSPLKVGAAVAAGYVVAAIPGTEISPVLSVMVVALLSSTATRRSEALRERLRGDIEDLKSEKTRLTCDGVATRESSEVAAAVLAAAQEFTAAQDPASIAAEIARGITAHLHSTGTVLLLWDEAVETFRIGAIHGRHVPCGTDLRQVEVRPDSIPTLRPAGPGEVVRVEPSAVREPMLASLLRRWKSSSLIGVRLQRGERLLGVLFAARGEGQAVFSVRDSRILGGIAVHAAAALDHADLIADLQSANQLKEEFMATMSHELRTPLNVIIGYTDLQMEGAFGDLTDDHRATLSTIREQALQLLELIQATLDMSRLERGLVTVDLRDISIPQFIEQLRIQIPPAWRKPSVDLNWRVEPSLPPIRTDPSKLQILLRNLIHNGLKFTHHGMVTVSVAMQEAKQQITFVVQDSGMGIKSEHLSEIFEMFRQVGDATASPGGVGLGLYIVKRLATVLGAEIEVSSAPGRGATFRIHLPVAGPLANRG